MDYWYEVRAFTERVGRPFFVSGAKLGEVAYTGFRSVYGYDGATRDLVLASGSSANLRDVPVYSDTVFVDFDDKPDAASDFLLWLYDHELQHSVWESGGRSVHVHVSCVPEFGAWVPQSQHAWVRTCAPGADTTFYHPAGMFRLPGTRHKKTGKRKVKVRELGGHVLQVPRRVPQAHAPVEAGTSTSLHAHLLRVKTAGGRRVWVWHLAKLARAEGLSYAEALAKIGWWNGQHAKPSLAPEEVAAKISEVYQAGEG